MKNDYGSWAGYVKSQKTPKFSIPSHFEFCPSTLQSALVPSQSVSHTHAALQSPTLSDTPLSNLASPDFASPNLAQTPPTSGSPLSDLAQTPRRRFPLIVANHQLRLLRNRLPAPPSPPCSDVPSLLRRPLPVPHLFLDALRQAAAITTCNSPHLLLIFDSFSGFQFVILGFQFVKAFDTGFILTLVDFQFYPVMLQLHSPSTPDSCLVAALLQMTFLSITLMLFQVFRYTKFCIQVELMLI
ncbi:hypothetical protein LXL04_006827 [Taraxacum kok-saghyz]